MNRDDMATRQLNTPADAELQTDVQEPEVLPPDSLDGDTPDLSEDELDASCADIEISPEGDILSDVCSPDYEESSLPVPRTQVPGIVGSQNSLQAYLREMSRFPLLQPDEEYELARLVRDRHDNDAAFRLISSHLRLVVRIAMDFQRRWMQNVMDLIQEGNVGLMRALEKFDPDKGIKFSYYASFWIRAYILKFIMDNWRMVKIGTTQAQRKLFYNLNRERRELIASGFDPDSATLASRLGVDEKQVIEMQQRLDASDMSLNAPVSTDDAAGATHMDFLPAPDQTPDAEYAGREVAKIVREKLAEIIPSLSEKELFILEHRLLTDDPVTLRAIGEKYNVTRERVRQLEARLLQKLKTHFGKGVTDFDADFSEEDE